MKFKYCKGLEIYLGTKNQVRYELSKSLNPPDPKYPYTCDVRDYGTAIFNSEEAGIYFKTPEAAAPFFEEFARFLDTHHRTYRVPPVQEFQGVKRIPANCTPFFKKQLPLYCY